jgi:hypothetical protein
MGFSFKKLGRFIDPTRSGSIGNKILGSVPIVGDTLKGAAEVTGQIGSAIRTDSKGPQPQPTPYQGPNNLAPSGGPNIGGGFSAMLRDNPALVLGAAAVGLVLVVTLLRRR